MYGVCMWMTTYVEHMSLMHHMCDRRHIWSIIHIHTLHHSYGPSFTYIHFTFAEYGLFYRALLQKSPIKETILPFAYIHSINVENGIWSICGIWTICHSPFIHMVHHSHTYTTYVEHMSLMHHMCDRRHMSRTTHASTHDSLHRPPLWIM